MNKLFRIAGALFLGLMLGACSAQPSSKEVNQDTVLLAVPPMFDLPVPATLKTLPVLPSDSGKGKPADSLHQEAPKPAAARPQDSSATHASEKEKPWGHAAATHP